MKQEKWFDRKFDFSAEQNIFPSIIERLAGTPAHLEEKFLDISETIAAMSIDGSWTIKENLGHFSDLEPLWQVRLQDILSGKTELTIADLQNTKTNEAQHNKKTNAQLLSEFRLVRKQTVDVLQTLNDQQIFMSALHPRLKTPMRTMDLFLFVAEHDDHHLARITELVRLINGQQ